MIKYISAFLIFISIALQAQISPRTYKINEAELDKLPPSSGTQLSNSISNILVIGDTVWIGTSRGLSRTTDGGDTWINFYGTEAFGTESISAITYDHKTGTVIAATTHSVEKNGEMEPEGSGIRYSTDNGITWNSGVQPLDDAGDDEVTYGINTLKALPVTVAINNISYDLAVTPGTIWAATFAAGLRKSTDMGQTWQRVVLPPDYLDSVAPTDTLDFCMSPVPGEFCAEGHLNYRVFSVIAPNDSTLFVGTADGINKSTDGGVSWTKLNHQNQQQPISGNFVVALYYNSDNNTLWAATWKAEDLNEFYAVSYSTDMGSTWKTALDEERVHNFGTFFNTTVAVSDNGAFKTTDGGSWTAPGLIKDTESGLPLSTSVFLSAAYSSDGISLWLGSDNGLVKNTGLTGLWPDEWKIFLASTKLKDEVKSYAFPNPFSPAVEKVKIKYGTGGKPVDVTIRIFDFGMNYVTTVIQNVTRGGTVHTVEDGGVVDYWDGRDAAGSIVPNGVYFYRIDAGDNDPVFGKIMVLQ